MEDRKRRVLQAIVDDYIHTAEPVGSRTVARKYGLGVSPATIRNEMADLEEMGYLEQPHTSAGRVPSDKGYRFYVDTLPGGPAAGQVDVEAVRRALAQRAQRVESVVRLAAHLLSEMTLALAVASQPCGREAAVSELRLVPLRGTLALVLVVADDGRVLSRMVDLGQAPDTARLDEFGRALTQRLGGLSLAAAGECLASAVADTLEAFPDLGDLYGGVSVLVAEAEGADARLVVDGAPNLLKQPEFREVAKAQQVLAALEHRQLLAELEERERGAAGVEVAIGREIPVDEMAECSLVTAAYAAPSGVVGRIGVIGPRRMEYGRVMAAVEGVAAAVTAVLHGHVTVARLFGGADLPGGGAVPRTAVAEATGAGEAAGEVAARAAGRTDGQAAAGGTEPRRAAEGAGRVAVHGAAGGAAGREAGASVEGGRRDRLPPRTGALGRGTVDRQATGAGVPLAEGRDAPGHRAERPASARVAEFG